MSDESTDAQGVKCPGCDQPMLPPNVAKQPDFYDHASGCPNAQMERVVVTRWEGAKPILGLEAVTTWDRTARHASEILAYYLSGRHHDAPIPIGSIGLPGWHMPPPERVVSWAFAVAEAFEREASARAHLLAMKPDVADALRQLTPTESDGDAPEASPPMGYGAGGGK